MSNKSGTSSQVLPLPSGGGAIKGIGETFSPDLFTGTGNFTVPLAVPPGRNGFQPQLNLVYSTGNGNGPFGLGWNLSIPGVGRKTSRGVPRYDDAMDTFILSGAEDLVPVGVQGTAARYQPRTEGLFARIFHHRAADTDFWDVRGKDGLVSRYGTAGVAGADPAVIADPANRQRAFSWKLTQTTDPFGNEIAYEHERDSGKDGSHHWDQLYLKRIRYAEHQEVPGSKAFLVSVSFDYADRPDPFSEYRAGFEMRTRRRCKRIAVRTHAEGEQLVRTYEMLYLDERVAGSQLKAIHLPPNGVSLLSQVRVVGHDERQPIEADQTQALPPLEFSYTTFEPSRRTYQPFTAVGNAVPERSLAHEQYEMVDLFGNGLPDVVQMNGAVRYWRNLGRGVFDRPRPMDVAPAGVGLEASGVQMADLNGNGRADLLVTDGIRGGYYPLTFGEGWDRRGFVRYEHLPSVNLEAQDVRLVDLDGDGVVDALRTGPQFELYYNDARKGWGDVALRERGDPEAFPNVDFSDPRVKLADLTGDGLDDIVFVHDGRIDYWPFLGYGRWGRRVTMRNSPRFEDAAFFSGIGFDPARVLLGDVDGDGLDDLVYVASGHITVWINQSGNGWSDPIAVNGTPIFTDVDAVRLADMLGTGTAGVLWSYDHHQHGDSTYKFLDLTGGAKPYVLHEMNNHMGATTRVAYAPSTSFYLDDEQRPETRWQTALPFPVQVVSRVEVIDHFSGGKLTTEYRYHHGYWDGHEREFRGFGRVDQRDTEEFAQYHAGGLDADRAFTAIAPARFSPPLETRTWFHQGPIEDEYGGCMAPDLSLEFFAGDPNRLSPLDEAEAVLDGLPFSARRDALRSLRGRILRTELYALDGSAREGRPFTVTEQLHSVREEAAPGPGGDNRQRIFFPHTLAERTTQWERGTDPMTQLGFTNDYDACGQPRRQIRIACPRGWGQLQDTAARPFLATRSHTHYAAPVDPDVYLMDRTAKTTTFEVVNDGSQSAVALSTSPDDSPDLRIIAQTLTYYDGEAFVGRPLGEVGRFGAAVRSESLVLTEDLLHEAYKGGGVPSSPPEAPPYLVPGPAPPASPEYPQDFLDRVSPLAGYTFHAGDAERARGYFVAAARHRYDFHDSDGIPRGLLRATRDPLARDTTIDYGFVDLLPTQVTDPAGLVTRATYDARVLQPREMEDPNGNRTRIAYTPLGVVRHTAAMGKQGEAIGDTDDVPGTRFAYDFLAFTNSPPGTPQPVSVRTIRREHHVRDTDVPLPERDETIETVEYSDGFGRLLQARAQAEDVFFGDATFGGGVLPADQNTPAGDAIGRPRGSDTPPNVVVGGATVYDNKGRVVEQFEPFFDRGFAFVPPSAGQHGQKTTMSYDPRGQVVGTRNPDGSEQRVIFGVPGTIAAPDLRDPDVFEPTPWEAYTYDANDLAPLSASPDEPGTTLKDRAPDTHHFTPASIEIDALGRSITAIARNGPDPATNWFTTRSTYDIRGNLLVLNDALGRDAFRYIYNLADAPLRIESIDAGLRRVVLDAAGGELERRDSKGALILQAYDRLQRPIRLWARDDAEGRVSLRERLVYGDGGDPRQDPVERATHRAANRLGGLHEHYDEAGRLVIEGYDFKGSVLEKTRQVFHDEAILNAPGSAFQADWQPQAGSTLDAHAAALLGPVSYRTSVTTDGMSRIKTLRYPADVEGERKVLRPTYNRAGAMERVSLDGAVFVERIAYDAKGQRSLLALGNGVMTRYAYDRRTFRLARLRSERFSKPDPSGLRYAPSGASLQDLAYAYDLAGNITDIHDRTPASGVPNTALGIDGLDRAFTYDPIYRLLSATGRECDRPPDRAPWDHRPRCADVTRTRPYTERYDYDPLGNMLQLQHQTGSAGFTRRFSHAPGSNRLSAMAIGQLDFAYAHDPNGNMTGETASRQFEWNHRDQLKAFRTQAGGAEPSVDAHYLYDAASQRVKKLVRTQGGAFETTTYIDGLFEHHRWHTDGSGTEENNRLHVMDDQQRVALVRIGPPHPDDRRPAVQYHVGDHLGSSNLVISEGGGFINREEHTPYGETSFGSFARKRYRFTGKERDEESGLAYHWARYYSSWLARWTSCDPQGPIDGVNVYLYSSASPVVFTDPTGRESELGVNRDAQKSLSLATRLELYIDNVKGADPNESPKLNPISLWYHFSEKEQSAIRTFLASTDSSFHELVQGGDVALSERLALVKQHVEGEADARKQGSNLVSAASFYLSASEQRQFYGARARARSSRQALEAGRSRARRQIAQGDYRWGVSHLAIAGAAVSEGLQFFLGVSEEKSEGFGRLASSVAGLASGGRRAGARGRKREPGGNITTPAPGRGHDTVVVPKREAAPIARRVRPQPPAPSPGLRGPLEPARPRGSTPGKAWIKDVFGDARVFMEWLSR